MKRQILCGCCVSLIVAAALGGGCTEPPLGWDGAGRQQGLPGPANDAGFGDGEAGLVGLCIPKGVVCHVTSDCCDVACTDGACGGPIGGASPFCAPDGVVCVSSADCCDGFCGMGVCGTTPSPVCVPEFVACHVGSECCNNPQIKCTNGACCGAEKDCTTDKTPPLCIPAGVTCDDSSECCTGSCVQGSDLSFVCATPPP